MTKTHSIDDVAKRYRLNRDQVMARLRAKTNPWPHIRPSKRDASTWCFTDEDVAAIDEMLHKRGPSVDSWGRIRRTA